MSFNIEVGESPVRRKPETGKASAYNQQPKDLSENKNADDQNLQPIKVKAFRMNKD